MTTSASSGGRKPARRNGVAQASNSPMPRSAAFSTVASSVGRRRIEPASSVCSNEAWISTPGMVPTIGAGLMSPRPAAEAPTKTMCPASRSAVIRPDSTSAADTYWVGSSFPYRTQARACVSTGMCMPRRTISRTPCGPLRSRRLSAPTASRSVSSAKFGTSLPPTTPTSGTRRTIPSTSAGSVTRPNPLAASARTGTAPTTPGKSGRKARGSSPIVTTGAVFTAQLVAGSRRNADAGDTQDHRAIRHRLRHARVIVGQLGQGLGHVGRQVRHLGAIDRRRVPVLLCQQHIEGHDPGAGLAEPIEQLRENRARPGPLADLGEAGIVDVDDRDRQHGLRRPGVERLQFIEDLELESLDDRGIEIVQDDEEHDDQGADETRRQIDAAFVGKPWTGRVAGVVHGRFGASPEPFILHPIGLFAGHAHR